MLDHARELCLPAFAGTSSDETVQAAHRRVQQAIGRKLGSYVGQTAVLNELFEYNVPFWNFSAVTNMGNVLERTNLVAAESRRPESWQNGDPDRVVQLGSGHGHLEHGVEADRIVETGDPGLLGVYRASYGLPLFLLNEIPALRDHYLRRRALNRQVQGQRQGLSLHLAAAWNNEPPVDLALDEQGQPLIAGTTD
jgi:hypothetical protein